MRSPVPFESSWILERGVRHAKGRPGLQCVDLWCVVCVWHSSGVVQVWTVGFLGFVEGSFLCARPIETVKFFISLLSIRFIQSNGEDSTVTLQSKLQVPRLHAAPIVGPVVSVETKTLHPAIQPGLPLS